MDFLREPIASWSPCCEQLRLGVHPENVMHSGLCRGAHHGEEHLGRLGPTVRLIVHPEDLPLLEGYVAPDKALLTFSLGRREPHRLVVGCACYECRDVRSGRTGDVP